MVNVRALINKAILFALALFSASQSKITGLLLSHEGSHDHSPLSQELKTFFAVT